IEKSHGNEAKPPSSATTDGTAVAMTVASMATRAVESMIPMRTGPRSDRNPTPEDAAACSTLTAPRVGRLHLRVHKAGTRYVLTCCLTKFTVPNYVSRTDPGQASGAGRDDARGDPRCGVG